MELVRAGEAQGLPGDVQVAVLRAVDVDHPAAELVDEFRARDLPILLECFLSRGVREGLHSGGYFAGYTFHGTEQAATTTGGRSLGLGGGWKRSRGATLVRQEDVVDEVGGTC